MNTKNKTTTATFEMNESPMKGRRSKYGREEEEGDWEELRGDCGEGRDKTKGIVDLKDILREGGSREVEGSPPQTPGAGKAVGADDSL